MSARTLLYKLMVLSPMVFLLCIATESRTRGDDFVMVGMTPAQHEAVRAYVPIVKATQADLGKRNIQPGTIRKLGRAWLAGLNSGSLESWEAIDYTDAATEGAKGQVFSIRTRLVGRLQRLAQREAEAGRVDQGCKDAMMGIQLAECLKYCDFGTVYRASSEQRKFLEFLRRNRANASAPVQREIVRTAERLLGNQISLDPLARRTRKLFAEHRRRSGERALAIEQEGRSAMAMPFGEDTMRASADLKGLGDFVLASRDEDVPILLSEVRLGHQIQNEFVAELSRFADLVPGSAARNAE